MGRKQKHPKIDPRKKPTLNKRIPDLSDSVNFNRCRPCWVLETFDVDGPWGKCNFEKDQFWNDILPKLRGFETQTWGEILYDKKRNHSVLTSQIAPEAQKRLLEITMDDNDELFRFRLNGEQRLWGIREQNVFKILWWDPRHKVYPSQKKHT